MIRPSPPAAGQDPEQPDEPDRLPAEPPGPPGPPGPERRRPPRAVRRRRWRRTVAWAIVGLLAATVAFYAGGGWYFADRLYAQGLSAAAKRAATPTYDIPVRSIGGGTATFVEPNGRPEVGKPGVWGVRWPGGYGIAGPITARAGSAVTRDFRLVTGTPPAAGSTVGFDDSVYPVNPKVGAGLDFRNVSYPGPLGRYPAWLVPGTASTWVITVHGNSLSRLDTIKVVPTLHSMGLPVLMASYRNDPGAPSAPDGQLGYGRTEWPDLQAAVRYALDNGARRVVLLGYSMGGAVVVSFLLHSALASEVSAAVLDAPVLDFSAAVDLGASQQRLPVLGLPLPASLTWVAKELAAIRYGVGWSRLDYLHRAGQLKTPILLFQGGADRTVPPSGSDALARARPDLVTYVRVPGADHLEEWNLNPIRYDATLRAFLTAHGG